MQNGVKNLKGARLFPKTFSNNGNGDAYMNISFAAVLCGPAIHYIFAFQAARGLSTSSFRDLKSRGETLHPR
jgi:hypothetical protein